MKILNKHLLAMLALLALATLNFQRSQAFAQGTAFTYQGQLANNGLPANGNYDLTFSLFNASSGTGQLGATLTNSAVTVSNGLFTVILDFGNQFPGADRWLEIGVRTNGGGVFTTLAPRQKLAPSPYAIYSANAGSATSATTAISATTATTANNFSGSLSGDVTGTQGAVVVASVGGQTAAKMAAGASAANSATNINTVGTIVKRDGSGNFAAGAITATSISGNGAGMTSLNPANLSAGTAGINISGNAATATSANSATTAGSATFATTAASATTAATANNFSGSLAGDVTGTQGATVVAKVGAQTAANVASGASAANAATSANTPNTILKRDGSGNVSAGAVTAASFSGNGSALTSLNGANLTSGSVGSNQLAFGAAVANLQASGQSGVASGGVILSPYVAASNLVSAGYVRIGKTVLGVDTWDQRASVPIAGRIVATAVWTGSEMIMWGGESWSNGTYFALGDGARYNPTLNTWTVLNTNGAPSARVNHTAVWTGTKMLVWGGYNLASGQFLGDGASYDPITDSWTPISGIGAPSPREAHSAVWTGSEMIIWGGIAYDGINYSNFNDGAKYNPSLGTWTAMATNNLLAGRNSHAAVWTGSKMVVWGGVDYYTGGSITFQDGAIYDPTPDTWTNMSITAAPSGRDYITPVWTGNEMIIWGGLNRTNSTSLGDGARYNPVTDTWTSMTASGAPTARYGYSSVWTGTEMIVFAGNSGYLNSGARYNPTTDSWQPTSNTGAPPGRYLSTAVWTGAEMIVFGGEYYQGNPFHPNDNYSYTPPTTMYLYLKP